MSFQAGLAYGREAPNVNPAVTRYKSTLLSTTTTHVAKGERLQNRTISNHGFHTVQWPLCGRLEMRGGQTWAKAWFLNRAYHMAKTGLARGLCGELGGNLGAPRPAPGLGLGEPGKTWASLGERERTWTSVEEPRAGNRGECGNEEVVGDD